LLTRLPGYPFYKKTNKDKQAEVRKRRGREGGRNNENLMKRFYELLQLQWKKYLDLFQWFTTIPNLISSGRK